MFALKMHPYVFFACCTKLNVFLFNFQRRLQLEIMRKVSHGAVGPCRLFLVSPIHLHRVYKSYPPPPLVRVAKSLAYDIL